MDLFENLQIMKKESKETLIERDTLSVSEYNKIKIALNKNNSMKGNFILHPGKIEGDNYRLRLTVYGAFKNKEHDDNSYHSYNRDKKNDEVTRDGVGTKLYDAYINLIDETIKFGDIQKYYISDYIMRYEKYLLHNNTINRNEIDVDSLLQSIIDVAEASKNDLENVLHSKNFIYNLTGKRKVLPKDSEKYNLDLENAVLKEDFDPSMPNWLKKAIKMNNSKRSYSGHKDLNYVMPLDTMKWTVEPFPEKGKLNNIGDDEFIALLIDKSGDSHDGDYITYFPSAYIGNNETININGRNRRIDSMSLRALAPYVKEFAHTVGYEKSISDVRQKQQDRALSKDGSLDRINDEDNWHYGYADKIDKSGYVVDPNKYKRLLAQMKHEDYASRLNDLYVVLSDVRTKLKEFISKDEVIPEPGSDYNRNRMFNRINRAYKHYHEALSKYNYAVDTLEKIKDGKDDGWRGESFTSFDRHVADAEVNVVNCLNELEPKN